MDKDEEKSVFLAGMFAGVLLTTIVYVIAKIIAFSASTNYDSQLVIKYHNRCQKYDKLAVNLVEKSGIATNFVNKKVSVLPWRTEWTFTNPPNHKNQSN